MIKQQIKEYFKDKKINYSGVNKFLKSNEKISKVLDRIVSKQPEWESKTNYINAIVNNIELKPFLFGGTGSDSLNLEMPLNGASHLEAGSKNIIAIYGLHESLKWLKNHNIEEKERTLFKYLYQSISSIKKVITYLPSNIDKCCGILSFNVAPIMPASLPSFASSNIISFLLLNSKFPVKICFLRGSSNISL